MGQNLNVAKMFIFEVEIIYLVLYCIAHYFCEHLD